jgi:xanthine dehydrogenase YagS FAD-binding subunit
VREFAYERPETVDAAVAAWGDDARYLAGGTNLVDLMKLGVEAPARLIDVRHLALDTIEGGAVLRVGAGVRNSDLAHHPDAPAVLREALLSGASGQLRNVATVGGNLLQRTRCSYFQDVSKPCNKRQPGSGCPAIAGDHRNLAVLAQSEDCVATYPGDMAVALAVLDAVIETDRREIGLAEFYVDGEPHRETVLAPGELITHVTVPRFDGPSSYRKVRDRQSYAFAVVSLAVAGDRIAFGGLAHKPWRALKAEAALAAGATAAEAADAEFAGATPLPGNAFKVTIARNLLIGAFA